MEEIPANSRWLLEKTVKILGLRFSWIWHYVVWWMVTNVSEGHTDSLFIIVKLNVKEISCGKLTE
jgi:hypothetical protein